MVDITLLGTGGGMPTPNRFLFSTLINFKGRKILIDCGEGTQVSMKIASTGFKSIDYILISHCHGDHIFGLPGLLQTIGNSGREEEITIIGPEGIKEVMDGLLITCKYLPYKINIIENPKENIEAFNKDLIISTLEIEHTADCIGYSLYFKRSPKFDIDKAIKNNVPKTLWNRLQKHDDTIEFEGKTYNKDMVLGRDRSGIKFGFITDSRPTKAMESFLLNSDFFICEGTYGDSLDIDKAIKNKHMTFEEAASLAKKANVKKLCLTHFSVAINEPLEFLPNAEAVFKNTVIGEDRMSFSLKFPEEK